MLNTPKSHLPKGYPLPNADEQKKFDPVFKRAFEIHETAHSFKDNQIVKIKGAWEEYGTRTGILSPVKGRTKLSKAHYCDCYEQAYQELKDTLGLTN
jgi:hypothetical protein